MIQTESHTIFSRRFNQVCLSSLLFFMSFNMILPELNAFLDLIDPTAKKGYILLLFTLVALISRPISGKWVDMYGRIPVMIIGSAVAFVAGLLYPFVISVAGFYLLRCFHGFSTGFKPTGSAALIADIIPDKRRGEAMGYMGIMGSTGMALGPVIGSFIRIHWGYDYMFYTSSAIALLSVLVIINIKETLPKDIRSTTPKGAFSIGIKDVFEPRVLLPSIVFFLYCFGFGTVYLIVPEMQKHLFGIENKGLFFLIAVVSSLLARVMAGKISDKKGREGVLIFALLFMLLALGIIGLASSESMLYLGSVFFGISTGINSPTIYAWVTDLSLPQFKGRAFATMFMFMELGIGLGAYTAGEIYNNNPALITQSFTLTFGLVVLSLIILVYYTWIKKAPH